MKRKKEKPIKTNFVRSGCLFYDICFRTNTYLGKIKPLAKIRPDIEVPKLLSFSSFWMGFIWKPVAEKHLEIRRLQGNAFLIKSHFEKISNMFWTKILLFRDQQKWYFAWIGWFWNKLLSKANSDCIQTVELMVSCTTTMPFVPTDYCLLTQMKKMRLFNGVRVHEHWWPQ